MHAASQQPQTAFQHKAASYDAHAQVQADAAQWLAEWLPHKSAAARCLEMGAGTGLLSQHLAQHFSQLECSDLSPEMLEICQSRAPAATCTVRDAWEAPATPEDWEYLASSSLLQWAPCPLTAIQQWSTLLRPNGRLLLGFFAQPSLPEMMQVLGGEGPVTWRSPDDWAAIFAEAGLRTVRIESATHRYHYESALQFWKSIHGTGATVSRRIKPSAMLRFFREYESLFTEALGVYATWTFCRVELAAPGA